MTAMKIREALISAASGFKTIDTAVFTTFNFQPDFFENNVLPALFDIEDRREGRRRVQVNHQLSKSEVCVLYDASTAPNGGGIYRYQKFGIFLSGRFFHPKLIFIAGIHQDNDNPWIYLAVSSGNLTLSGWGKNQEVYGELWIGSNRQTLFGEVKSALEWLRDQLPSNTSSPALDRCLAFMEHMGGDLRSGITSNASFYFSPQHRKGFWPALQDGQSQKWDALQVLSPYWGEIDGNLEKANARGFSLIPALLDNGQYGLGSKAVKDREDVELFRLSKRDNSRFWHAKAYFLQRGDRVRVGIGSVNFTNAGLQGGDKGNVEAMIISEADTRAFRSMLPDLIDLDLDDPALPHENADDPPRPAPVVIIVLYDWKTRKYRLIFEPDQTPSAANYQLILPGMEPYILANKSSDIIFQEPKGPLRRSTFRLLWQCNGETQSFDGLINETNLLYSDKDYLRPLSLTEILENWRRPTDAPPTSGDEGNDENDDDDNEQADTGTAEEQLIAQFDVLNLYDMYRAFLIRRKRIKQALEEKDYRRVLSYLLTGADSIYRLAKLVGEKTNRQTVENPVRRYLVLLECKDMIARYRKHVPDFDAKFAKDVNVWFSQIQPDVANLCRHQISELPGKEVFTWFEDELKKAWRK